MLAVAIIKFSAEHWKLWSFCQKSNVYIDTFHLTSHTRAVVQLIGVPMVAKRPPFELSNVGTVFGCVLSTFRDEFTVLSQEQALAP